MNNRRSSRRYELAANRRLKNRSPRTPTSTSSLANKPYLISSGHMPPTENYPGLYNFAVLLGQVTSTKNKWVYSENFSKLYIVWHQVIPLEFQWLREEENLVVRALPLYTDPQHYREPVLRCIIHMDRNDPANEGVSEIEHVIRSENPGAVYEVNPESGRCSVVVPLGELQPGTGTVTVTYKFMCKTSCITGMMRRPMAVIFTLERPNGVVLGRQTMGVKVCSCPRRDMEKEENMLRRQLKSEVKRDYDGICYQLVISIPDAELFKKVLEFNHGGITSLLRTMPTTDPSYAELTDFLSILEEKLSFLSQMKNEGNCFL